jgi:poly(3-hydroxybutyrate) depolymerase
MPIHHRAIGTLAVRLLALGIVLIGFCVASLASAQVLGSYNAKIDETSVSGISSGAFMAVQIGVAHSANVKGVGATAGGPYFCGEAIIANELVGIGKVFSRCMQGDPAYPATPITAADLARMYQRAGEFAARGWIDPLSNLARQKVAIFHGYNDGIVKQPVSEALYTF